MLCSVWKGKDTVRSNYEKMGLAAELNSDASVSVASIYKKFLGC